MFDNLIKFCKIIECRSITKAAKTLNVSQPALTNSLKTLENQIGEELIIRSKRGVEPTQFGQNLYLKFQHILSDYVNLEKYIAEKNIENLDVGNTIKIGLMEHIAIVYVKKILKRFRKIYPDVTIKLYVDNEKNIANRLETNDIDIAILPAEDKDYILKDFKNELFLDEEMILVGDRRFMKIFNDTGADLNEIPFLSYPKDSFTHRIIQKYLFKFGVEPSFNIFSMNEFILKRNIIYGEGIGFMPAGEVSKELVVKQLYHLNIFEEKLIRKTYVLYSDNYKQTDYSQDLISMLKQKNSALFGYI